MREDLKQKFVEALRSDGYTQVTGATNLGNNCMCVNGVFLDVCVKNGIGEWESGGSRLSPVFIFKGEKSNGTCLDKQLLQEIGFKNSHDYGLLFLIENGERKYLHNLNDSFGVTFKEFADLIENSELGAS